MTNHFKKLALSVSVAAMLTGCASVDDDIINGAYKGNHAKVEKAIEEGADPNAKTSNKFTALHNAASNSNVSTTRILLEAGADPNVFSDNGVSPIYNAVAAERFEVTKLLIDAGARVNFIVPENQLSPLHAAIIQDNPKLTKLLIDNGANIETLTKNRTPLTLAVIYSDSSEGEIVKQLLNEGADPLAHDKGVGLMRALVASNLTDLIPAFVDAGLDGSIQDPESGLPIALASVFPDVSEPLPEQTAEKLVLVSESFGLNPETKGKDGLTARDLYLKGREVHLAQARVAELKEEQAARARKAAEERKRKEKSGDFWAKAIALGAGAVAIGYGVDQGLPVETAAEVGSALAADIILDTGGENLTALKGSLEERAAAAEQLAERDTKLKAELAQLRREDAAFATAFDAKNAEGKALIRDSLRRSEANLKGGAVSKQNIVTQDKLSQTQNGQGISRSGQLNAGTAGLTASSNADRKNSRIDAPPPAKIVENVAGSGPLLTYPEYYDLQERYGCVRPPAGCAWVVKSRYYESSGKMQWTIKNDCPGILAYRYDVPGTGGQGSSRTKSPEIRFHSYTDKELKWLPKYFAIYGVGKTSVSSQCYNEAFRTPVIEAADIKRERLK